MGKNLESVLNVTVVHEEGSLTEAVDLSEWTIEEETGALPAALWDEAKPQLKPSEPSAKLIGDCITGIKRLKPPAGKLGAFAALTEITWQRLDLGRVKKSTASQKFPSATHSRNVETVMIGKKVEQEKIAKALTAAGFSLAWQPAQGEIHFRELQADPIAGEVAAFS